MIIAKEELENISKTFYYLMRGVYHLDFFNSPYNEVIKNEYDEVDGNATKYFHLSYDSIHSLIALFNKIDNTHIEEYDLTERLHSAITDLLEDITTDSIKIGYQYANNSIEYEMGSSFYGNYTKNQLLVSGSVGNQSYINLREVLNEIRQYLEKENYFDVEGKELLFNLNSSLDHLFSVFVDTGFVYGQKLGKGLYPIWHNSDFD